MGNCVPYFAVSLILLCAIGRHRVCWCVNNKKLMSYRFLSVPELMSHCGVSARAHNTYMYGLSAIMGTCIPYLQIV